MKSRQASINDMLKKFLDLLDNSVEKYISANRENIERKLRYKAQQHKVELSDEQVNNVLEYLGDWIDKNLQLPDDQIQRLVNSLAEPAKLRDLIEKALNDEIYTLKQERGMVSQASLCYMAARIAGAEGTEPDKETFRQSLKTLDELADDVMSAAENIKSLVEYAKRRAPQAKWQEFIDGNIAKYTELKKMMQTN